MSGKVAKVLKMLCFFVFSTFLGAFVGWLILVYLGLEGLGVIVFLVFSFSSFVLVLFLFCLLCFCFVVGLLLLDGVFVYVFSFVFCWIFFFEGLRVKRGGPKGHLTWP